MNRRRKLVIALAVGALTLPLRTYGQQQGKVWRIGFIWGQSRATAQADIDSILRGMRELGYVEGRDFTTEYRWADGNTKLLPAMAAEMVRLKFDLIVTRGTPVALAVKSATREIPVVFSSVSDPVETGIVSTLARPGANLTGWSNMLPDTSGKLLELLKAMVPRMSRLAVVADPGNAGKALEVKLLQKAVERLGLPLRFIELRTASDIDSAFAQMSLERTNALIVLADGVTTTNQRRIVELAAKHRLPAIYQFREFVDAGGLISYGMNVSRQMERVAIYVDKIFKGAKPADLPVEQPTTFELVINSKAAKALSLVIPESLRISADKVID